MRVALMAQLSLFHSFILYYAHLIVTLASPKVLSLDNKNEKSDFHFVLCSLNRTFALKFENC